MDISRIATVAREAALEAGAILLAEQKSDFKIYKKGIVNLVTDVDLKAEKVILRRILQEFPDHRILCEEQGELGGTADCRWIIDPLDGTTNYAHRYPVFCVSIGVEAAGELIAGVVYNPVSNEIYTATRGGGAFVNRERLEVSACDSLIDSLLCTGFSYQREELAENLALFRTASMNAQAVRRDGSAALDLCAVAAGRFDGFWELTLHPWDVAAGMLIIQEAGGTVTAPDGTPCTHFDPGILASNGKIHEHLIRLLGKTSDSPVRIPHS